MTPAPGQVCRIVDRWPLEYVELTMTISLLVRVSAPAAQLVSVMSASSRISVSLGSANAARSSDSVSTTVGDAPAGSMNTRGSATIATARTGTHTTARAALVTAAPHPLASDEKSGYRSCRIDDDGGRKFRHHQPPGTVPTPTCSTPGPWHPLTR